MTSFIIIIGNRGNPGRIEGGITLEEKASGSRQPAILLIDAGGTMTDTFIIDREGEFVVSKSQTTPEDESVGLVNSAAACP